MSTESTVSPILAVVALALVFTMLSTLVVMDFGVGGPVRAVIRNHAAHLMNVVAVGAMSASLYYSDYVGFEPCHMCWYQRIAMYPLAVLLTVGTISRRDLGARNIVTLATIGLALSIYHYQLQLFPDQEPICSGPVSCTGRYVNEFGFVTIPFMAGCGFLSIILLQVARWRVEYLDRRAAEWDEIDANDATTAGRAPARA